MNSFPSQLLINGEWRPAFSGKKIVQINPATEEIITEVSAAGPQDVGEAAQAAHGAFKSWRELEPEQRAELLCRIARNLKENSERIAQTISSNIGKTIVAARQEVILAAQAFETSAKPVENCIPNLPPIQLGENQFRTPLGILGMLVPWNYPAALSCLETAPALAAGNCVILKPSSWSALTPLVLGELFLESGLPPGVFQVLPGLGQEVADPLVAHPLVRQIAFSGSGQVGTRIMELGARGLKRICLNIGKWSGLVVFADCEWEKTAANCAGKVFSNAGQDQAAHPRIWVEQKIFEPFLERFLVAVKKLRAGDPLDEETQVGPLISSGQRRRIEQFLQETRAAGRKIAIGGERLPGPGYFLRPSVALGVDRKDRLWNEEIFGPVAWVRSFGSEPDLLQELREFQPGMDLSICTAEPGRALNFVRELEIGAMEINPDFKAAVSGEDLSSCAGGTQFREGIAGKFTESKRIRVQHS